MRSIILGPSLSRLIIAIVAGLILCSPATAKTVGVQATEYKEWIANCQAHTNYCYAVTYINPDASSGSIADYWLSVGRSITGKQWEISITTIQEEPADGTEFLVQADDGEQLSFTLGENAKAIGSANAFYLIGDQASTLLPDLLSGTRLNVEFGMATGTNETFSFSLAGLKAALLWIDKIQDRKGEPRTAGMEPDPDQIFGVLAPSTDVLPGELLAYHSLKSSCKPINSLSVERSWELHQVSYDSYLYILSCWPNDTNPASSVYVYNKNYKHYSLRLFVDYRENGGWSGANILYNASFDPITQTLSSFHKGNDSGDCGTIGNWVWQDYDFKLNAFFAKPECGERSNSQAGKDFPQIYPAASN